MTETETPKRPTVVLIIEDDAHFKKHYGNCLEGKVDIVGLTATAGDAWRWFVNETRGEPSVIVISTSKHPDELVRFVRGMQVPALNVPVILASVSNDVSQRLREAYEPRRVIILEHRDHVPQKVLELIAEAASA